MSQPKNNFGAFASNAQAGSKLGLRADNEAGGDVYEQILRVQSAHGAVDSATIEQIAAGTATSEARVRAVGSFYSLVNLDTPQDAAKGVVRVCDGPSCCLRGAQALQEEMRSESSSFSVGRTSCLGYCDHAPVMLLDSSGEQRCILTGTTWQEGLQHPARATSPPSQLLSTPDATLRPLTQRFGIDPQSIDEALSAGVYVALQQALEMDAQDVIDTVQQSGLRGRGGAGFNTGQKWSFVAGTPADQRYVICNADESEPGTFKDRLLMESDPHSLLEGMAICGHAVGASQGIIYLRGEYQQAYDTLQRAIEQARERGFLGRDIFDREFDFDVSIHRGAGAYICGEESALIESLEGKRGEPRQRPPFPASHGYWGKPTAVNNVETLCSIPPILHDGPACYRDLGRGDTCGTKLFCLSGHVARPGVCEAALGTTVQALVDQWGGGIRDGRRPKLALTGGAAGTLIPPELFDVSLSYDSMNQGVSLGSGAIMIADDTVQAPDVLLWVLEFFAQESCGKCTPCRIGTVEARDIVWRIVAGQGGAGDVERLLRLAKTLGAMSFCGLGTSAAWPIESAIEHFRREFE